MAAPIKRAGSGAQTTCCLCHHDLASHEATLWIPGIDLPAHEGCLTLELSAL